VVERGHRGDASGEEVVDEPLVEVESGSRRGAAPGGLDAWPGDGEAVAVEVALTHQCDVRAVAAVVVAGAGWRAAHEDPTRIGSEGVPDARALAVGGGGTQDLGRRAAGAEPELAWKRP